MKLLSLEETLERLKGELDRVRKEAKTKYRTDNLKELKDTSGHDKQQAQDRKALAHQMETYINTIDHLDAVGKIKTMLNREATMRSWDNLT